MGGVEEMELGGDVEKPEQEEKSGTNDTEREEGEIPHVEASMGAARDVFEEKCSPLFKRSKQKRC